MGNETFYWDGLKSMKRKWNKVEELKKMKQNYHFSNPGTTRSQNFVIMTL